MVIPVYDEDELLPISALQHLLFCERRVALVFIENLWEENLFTAEGRIQHERTHEAGTEVRNDLRIARSLRIRSLPLGLSGVADVVEFHRIRESETAPGITLEGTEGLWRPVPVEYKRGRLRKEEGYEIQLCAQAMCLEEMLGVEIPEGYIFYGKTQRRLEILFSGELREETGKASARLHELIASGRTPKAVHTPRCERCSLMSQCLPAVTGSRRSVNIYLRRMVNDAEDERM